MTAPGVAAVQPRCPWCGTAQPGPAVIAFSDGETACHHCGRKTVPRTWEQMLSIRRVTTAMQMYPYTCTSCRAKHDTLIRLLDHLREVHPL